MKPLKLNLFSICLHGSPNILVATLPLLHSGYAKWHFFCCKTNGSVLLHGKFFLIAHPSWGGWDSGTVIPGTTQKVSFGANCLH